MGDRSRTDSLAHVRCDHTISTIEEILNHTDELAACVEKCESRSDDELDMEAVTAPALPLLNNPQRELVSSRLRV